MNPLEKHFPIRLVIHHLLSVKCYRRNTGLESILLMPWLALIVCLNMVWAAEESFWNRQADRPVPEGAKVTLEVNHPEYLLGENVLVQFILENIGDQPFEFSSGGDYRGADRHLRFKVTAEDESGHMVKEPYTSTACMGGLGGPRILKPGEKILFSLPLMRYCRIENPGRYTIRATHDFGWKEGQQKHPTGETTITFRMPDHQEAEQVIRDMLALPDGSHTIMGEHSTPSLDFRCLRFPIYIEILARMAREGDERAIEGLRYIPTVEATKTLIQLAGEPDQEMALQAANVLYERLPLPEAHYMPNVIGASGPPKLSIRGDLVERSWDDTLAPEVRAVATKLLQSEDIHGIAAGALVVTCVGSTEDAAVVNNAINRIRESTYHARKNPDDNILDFPQPLRELLRAMDALHKQGYLVGEYFVGEAEILLYFHYLSDTSAPRSEQWLEHLNTFGVSGWYPIRMEAVRSIPKPMPEECIDFVKARLEDQDLGVCRAACIAAGDSGKPAFIRPLLDIVATEHHDWLLREASNAAQKLGAGFDLYETWAGRLHEAGIYDLALDSLQSVLELPRSYSGRIDLKREERLSLQEAWKQFLNEHAGEIRAGKQIKITDPGVTPALAGRARVWRLPDGSSWPVTAETDKSN